MINLCDTCINQWPECLDAGQDLVFGIDKDPNCFGSDADTVIECKEYLHKGEIQP